MLYFILPFAASNINIKVVGKLPYAIRVPSLLKVGDQAYYKLIESTSYISLYHNIPFLAYEK
jgi:hypothetical protein